MRLSNLCFRLFISLVFLFLILKGAGTQISDEPLIMEEKLSGLQLNFVFSVAGNYHLSYPKRFRFCVEDCVSSHQNPGIGYGYAFDIASEYKKNRHLIGSLGFSKHIFSAYDFDLVFGGPFPDQVAFKTNYNFSFINAGAGYGVNKGNFYLENRIVVDLSINDSYDLIKPITVSYQANFRFKEFRKVLSKLILEPYVKIALMNYKKGGKDFFGKDKAYLPFSIGIRLNLHSNLKYKES